VKRSPLRRTAFVAKVSEKQRLIRSELRQSRKAIIARSGGRCEARLEGICAGEGQHAHHVVRRSQGGTHAPDNLKWVCGICHYYIHAQPAKAMSLGLLASSAPPRRSATGPPPVANGAVDTPLSTDRALRGGVDIPKAHYSTREAE
jgi:hypothetical protein